MTKINIGKDTVYFFSYDAVGFHMTSNWFFFIMLLIHLPVFSQNTDTIKKTDTTEYQKYKFGGYGEMLYQHMDYGPDRYSYVDGAQPDKRSFVDLPRLIFSFKYKFRKDLELDTEVEFEHGGTGSALELEYEEMGEYEMEMEKAGEVVLEEFQITKTFSKAFKIRLGHMIVPVGITNARHLPTQFFNSARPEGENNIIPLTWHETGLAILGDIRKWSYKLLIVNGLDANGFSSAYWINFGRQTIFETTKMTNPAFVARIENKSIKNLNLGTSFYVGNSAANTAKPEKMEHLKGTVSIYSFDLEYNNKKIITRANIIYGSLSDSYDISKINKSISKNIQYPRTPVASNALTYSIETGFDVLSFFNVKEKLYPFIRYEYYNAMEKTDDRIFADARYKRDVLSFGINYFLLSNMVIKIDYSKRFIDKGNFNTENTIGIALGFNGWFVSK